MKLISVSTNDEGYSIGFVLGAESQSESAFLASLGGADVTATADVVEGVNAQSTLTFNVRTELL